MKSFFPFLIFFSRFFLFLVFVIFWIPEFRHVEVFWISCFCTLLTFSISVFSVSQDSDKSAVFGGGGSST